MDNFLNEQILNISKAGAYDAIFPKYKQMQEELAAVKHERDLLQIELKWANERIKIYQQFINDVRPEDATVIELAPNQDDLKELNI